MFRYRIAELSNGTFIIQRRVWLFWWTLATNITDGCYDSLRAAQDEVRRYLKKPTGAHIVAYWGI